MYNIVESYLHLADPILIDVHIRGALHGDEYPRELRLCIKVRHGKSELRFSGYIPEYEHIVHIIEPKGFIELKKSGRDRWVKLLVDKIVPESLSNPKTDFSICSKPLSLEELHTISNIIKGDEIDVRWDVKAYGMIPQQYIDYLMRGLEGRGLKPDVRPSSFVIIGTAGVGSIDYTRFVRKVIVPSDLVTRIFVEMPVKPVGKEAISRIKEPKIREALKVLLEKQAILREALEKYRMSSTSEEYRDVITDARRAIEHITKGKDLGEKVFEAMKDAYESLNIIEEMMAGVRGEKINEIMESINSLSKALFALASVLGVHSGDCKPKPRSLDAEFVLYSSICLLNYMAKTLMEYGSRL